MLAVLYCKYYFNFSREFQLIDLDMIKRHNESWDLVAFQATLNQQTERARDFLKYSWFSDLQNMFLLVSF